MEKKGCTICQKNKRKTIGLTIFALYAVGLMIWGQVELIKVIYHKISTLL
jgi:hypothetical protein